MLLWLVACVGGDVPPESPAAPAPSRTVPATASSSTFLDFDVFDASDLTFDSVEVTTDLAGDVVTVRVVARPFNGDQVVRGFETRAGVFGWAQVAPGLVVALVPEPVRTVFALDGGESHVDTGELPEWDAVAVGIQTPDRPFAGLIWEGADGVLRNSAGDVVPSAELTYQVEELPAPGLTSRSVLVFRDEMLSVWGYIDRNGDSPVTGPLDTQPVGSIQEVSSTSDGDYSYALTAIGFLPVGGSDPDLGLAVPAARWTAAELGDSGRIAFVAVADKIEPGLALVERVTYTDKSGSRVSYEPR
jgi:hypothetical protein